VLVLFFTVFIDLVGFGIVLPLQPFYAQKFGATPDVITLVAASFTLTQFLCAPVWGRLSDRIGRRPVLLITIFGTVIGYLWLALTDTLIMLFVARAFGGAMAANIGVAHACVADMTQPEERSRGMGRIGAAAGLGFVAGPTIGGLLAGPDPVDPNFQLPFLAAAAFSLLAFILAVFFLRETVDRKARDAAAALKGSRLAALRDALARPNVGLLLLLVAMTPFVFSGIETILAIWTEFALAWGPEQNGYLYAFMGFTTVIVQGLMIGPLTRLYGEKRLIGGGAVSIFLGALWLPWTTGYADIMGALGLVVFGVCMCGPSLTSLISQHAADHERGRLLGVSQSSAGLGRILGPALSGVAYSGLGPSAPFLVGAAVMVVMFTLSLGIARQPDGPE
jgi:multidrug resistance protein